MENHSSSGLFLSQKISFVSFLPFSIFLFFYFLLASQLVSIENYFSPQPEAKTTLRGIESLLKRRLSQAYKIIKQTQLRCYCCQKKNSFLKTFGKPLSHLTEEKPCLLEGLIPGDRKTVRMVLSYRFLCWHERLTPVICSNVFFIASPLLYVAKAPFLLRPIIPFYCRHTFGSTFIIVQFPIFFLQI